MNKKLATGSAARIAAFRRAVWSRYRAHGRHDMPWRRDRSPYAIAVSEIMLQQTQVSRVWPKFESWMRRFPSWRALASAPTKDILREWSGLGYNRRALYLKRIAEAVVASPEGELAGSYEALRALPGIGPNTAGAILAYAFDEPHPFIETNIRSAFIHFFFPDAAGRRSGKRKISDADLMPLIEAALDRKRPREWHWALMDYGAHIKSEHPNPSRRSAHHVRQKPFKGSNREFRAAMLRRLVKSPATEAEMAREFAAGGSAGRDLESVRANLAALCREGFLAMKGKRYRIV